MTLYEDLLKRREKISIIGLGYVGLPIAVAFARKLDVIGYDYNQEKINCYLNGMDPTNEVGDSGVQNTKMRFTVDASDLDEAKFHIVAVPTPVKIDRTPDLSPLENASRVLGKHLSKGSVVVYESTVYPGVTEDVCVPILEQNSGLKCGVDFKVGYSPERINPGDKTHRLENIVKVVSGMDDETLDVIAKVYSLVVDAGVYRAQSIKVAEAAKVIENSQRDINIAFMNELSIIFHRMGIDTLDVLEAAQTKWNFLPFRPGLVGGHCIGVDPYYLTYKAESLGYRSQVILSGRYINDSMGKYVAENLVKRMIHHNIPVKNAHVAILGITFKENCPDVRNSKVVDIYLSLKEYDVSPKVIDPVANGEDLLHGYGIELEKLENVCDVDAVVLAVPHQVFKQYDLSHIKTLYRSSISKKIFFDVKGLYDADMFRKADFDYWRL